jgi:hypothetical protein
MYSLTGPVWTPLTHAPLNAGSIEESSSLGVVSQAAGVSAIDSAIARLRNPLAEVIGIPIFDPAVPDGADDGSTQQYTEDVSKRNQ